MKILIIEDDQRVAELIKRGLEEQGYDVMTAFDGYFGKKLALQKSFDLIITDVVLPKINGLDLCREIRESLPEIPIIMLTALGTTDDKIEGFDAGADDYLVKPFDFRELHVRIRVLINRKNTFEKPGGFILKVADIEVNLNTKIVKRSNVKLELTAKEYKLLLFFMHNKNRVLTRTEIAENVWDTQIDTGTNFIDVYINYLRKKVDKEFDVKLIHTKTGMGFILRTEDDN